MKKQSNKQKQLHLQHFMIISLVQRNYTFSLYSSLFYLRLKYSKTLRLFKNVQWYFVSFLFGWFLFFFFLSRTGEGQIKTYVQNSASSTNN